MVSWDNGSAARGAAILLVLLGPAIGRAHAAVSASGYLKDLFQYSRTPLTRAPHGLNLSRARASLDASGGLFKAHADYDHELRAGAYFHTPDFRALGLAEPEGFLDMEHVVSTGGSYQYRHRLYRAWAAVESEQAMLRFGRQRVAWGSAKLWNPTDVLNPYEPVSVERDERRGTDALYARAALGTGSQAEAAWGLGDRWASSDLLARWTMIAAPAPWGATDVSVLGGHVAGSTASWMGGLDAAADLWGGSWHAEWTYTEMRRAPPAAPPPPRVPGLPVLPPPAPARDKFWRLAAGYEYTFSASPPVRGLKDAWVLAEYYHNGAGEPDTGRYDPARLLGGREVALGTDYAGWGYRQDLHPLVKVELYVLVNLNDGSHFVGPSLDWNAMESLHLAAGLQRFGGGPPTEFGRLANILYLQAQYYF
jgi:hypothetical protein